MIKELLHQFGDSGYSVSNCATLFGLLVPGIPVQTVPLFWV